MKAIKKLSFLLAFAVALVFTGCKPTEVGSGDSLEINPSSLTMKANDKDIVTFAVMSGDENVTSEATIEDVTDSTKPVALPDNKFKTNKVGEYKFRATYEGKTSAVVTITATAVELVVDKDVIYDNGDVAKFTVLLEGNDVTSESVITNITESKDLPAGTNTFTTTKRGVYEFKATYNKQVTSTVTVTVEKAPPSKLRLAASKGRIKPDGSETTAFTVYYEGNDVTASAKVKNVATGDYVDDKTFSYTGTAKTVDFVAEYNETTSPALSIGFGDFYKMIYIMKITGTWCGPCGILTDAFNAAFEIIPERVNIVAAHSNGLGIDPFQIKDISIITQNYDTSQGLPSTYYDISDYELGANSSSGVVTIIKPLIRKGTTAGLAAVSKVDGTTLTIDVNVTASTSKEYYLGVMLCEDGITGYKQAGDSKNLGTKYPHNHTLRALGPSVMGESLGVLAENTQVTKTFTFNISNYNKDNCNVVCYLTTKEGDSYVAVNSITCPAVGWVDYRFEK